MLRKDAEAHERDDSWKHNRLLLGKVKEQQLLTLRQQQVNQLARDHQQQLHGELKAAHEGVKRDLEVQRRELDEVRGAHNEVMDELEEVELSQEQLRVAHYRLQKEHEGLKEAHDGLQHEHEELKGRVKGLEYEVITLRVKHAELVGREPFVPEDPAYPTRLYSEEKVVRGHTVWMFVAYEESKDKHPQNEDHYGVAVNVRDGHFPCKVTYAFELVHHGGTRPAKSHEKEHVFTKSKARGDARFVRKARLASPDNNPYVKDGYVTFKCTLKIVDE
jgi:hypothetical protein